MDRHVQGFKQAAKKFTIQASFVLATLGVTAATLTMPLWENKVFKHPNNTDKIMELYHKALVSTYPKPGECVPGNNLGLPGYLQVCRPKAVDPH